MAIKSGGVDLSIVWGYSIQHVDGKPVMWLDVAWTATGISGGSSVPVDYIDMGVSDVQLVDALLNGKITKAVFDAIAYAAQIRRNDPNRRQYLLNLLGTRSAARGHPPVLQNASSSTYSLSFVTTMYEYTISDGMLWLTGSYQVLTTVLIDGYRPLAGAGQTRPN